MGKVEVKIEGSEVLARVSRMFENTANSVLLEIFQNGRRSGATEIYIAPIEGGVVIGNNGEPIKDFQNLLTLGKSEWDDSITHEDPAGAGFFAVTMADKAIVSSYGDDGGERMCIDTELLTKIGKQFEVIPIESGDKYFKSSTVEYKLYGEKFVTLFTSYFETNELRKSLAYYPLDMYLENNDGKLEKITNHYDARAKHLLYDTIKDGCRFRVYTKSFSGNTGFNYYGHYVSLFMDFPVDIEVTPEDDCKVLMVLPGRHTIVQNEAYDQLCKNMNLTMGEYYMKVCKGEHLLEYNQYKKIKQVLPEFPEALPFSYLEGRKYLYIEPQYEGYDNEQAMFKALPVGIADSIFSYTYDKYRGYSWIKRYEMIETLETMDGDKLLYSSAKEEFDTTENIVIPNGDPKIRINKKESISVDYILLIELDYSYADSTYLLIGKNLSLNSVNDIMYDVEELHVVRDSMFDSTAESDIDDMQKYCRETLISLLGTEKDVIGYNYAEIHNYLLNEGIRNCLLSNSGEYAAIGDRRNGVDLFKGVEHKEEYDSMTQGEKIAYLFSNLDDKGMEKLEKIMMVGKE